MGILGMLILLTIKCHKHAPSHEQVVFVTLKQPVSDKFLHLREFESDLHSYREKSKYENALP